MGGLGNTLERRLDSDSIRERDAKIVTLSRKEGLETWALVERFGLSPARIRDILRRGRRREGGKPSERVC